MNDWINLELLSHPANWIIVILVLLFVSVSAMAIFSNAGNFLPSLSKGS